ncbi:OpgC family protein [Bartonella rattaustraliani]|uniref:OpgC family protein n=1 Tax=Bartonella rattaustraliani TaxID=481139 RepID=UPI0002DD7155|nr:OpgC domain-containing protein [Bartonella rattaustraliani]
MGYQDILHHRTHLSHRDTSIDVFRSLALLTIFINHIPGTLYEHITHRNFGFSDSAEVFVLLSGVSLGLSFHARLYQESFPFIVRKLWKRAFQLYGAYLFTTFATLSLFLGAFLLWGTEKLLKMNNVELFFIQPFVAFLSTLTFGHQLGYNNILPLYIFLMFFAPFALYLSCKQKKLLLLSSFTLYLICGFYKIAPSSYPLPGKWFLNPLSWQFLFVIGLVSTLSLKQGKTIAFHPFLIVFSGGYLLLSLLWVRLDWWGVLRWLDWSSPLLNFNKTFLSLPRLLHVLALSTFILCLPSLHKLFRVSKQHPLAILGKHSLPVFVTGTVFAMFGQIFKTVMTGTFFSDSILIISGIALQFGVAYCYEKRPFLTVFSKKTFQKEGC